MNYARRCLVGGALGAIPAYFAQPAQAQNEPVVSGTVRPLGVWTVQLYESNGFVQTVPTNPINGEYVFKQPAKVGPCLLVFRNQNAITVHEVNRLTAGIRQTVSVTIDPNAKTFESIHNTLQSQESLAVFAQAFPPTRPALLNDVQKLTDSIGPLKALIDALPGAQRDFLTAKGRNVEALARATLG